MRAKPPQPAAFSISRRLLTQAVKKAMWRFEAGLRGGTRRSPPAVLRAREMSGGKRGGGGCGVIVHLQRRFSILGARAFNRDYGPRRSSRNRRFDRVAESDRAVTSSRAAIRRRKPSNPMSSTKHNARVLLAIAVQRTALPSAPGRMKFATTTRRHWDAFAGRKVLKMRANADAAGIVLVGDSSRRTGSPRRCLPRRISRGPIGFDVAAIFLSLFLALRMLSDRHSLRRSRTGISSPSPAWEGPSHV